MIRSYFSSQCAGYIRMVADDKKTQTYKLSLRYKPKEGLSVEGWRRTSPTVLRFFDRFPVSTDLATLVVLFINKLCPGGVLADKLQEELPNLDWAAECLREWDRAREWEEAT